MSKLFCWLAGRLAFIALAVVGAGLAFLAYSNIGHADITHGDGVGKYTYHTDTCDEPDENAGDPINVVFYNDATAENIAQGFSDHGGWGDNGGETQYFKINGLCNEMDGQPSSERWGLSRYHARYHRGLGSDGGVDIDPTWGDYSVAAAHYEDVVLWDPRYNDCHNGLQPWDHAVPANGFNEGRDNVVDNWTQAEGADHYYWGTTYWDNTQQRTQCNGTHAYSDGNVAFIRVQPEGNAGGPVGGIAEYPELAGDAAVGGSSSSAPLWTALAGAGVGGVLLLAAGGLYLRFAGGRQRSSGR